MVGTIKSHSIDDTAFSMEYDSIARLLIILTY